MPSSLYVNKKNPTFIIGGSLLLLFCALFVVHLLINYFVPSHPIAKQELKHFESHLALGDTQSYMINLFQKGEYKNLSLKQMSPEFWITATPDELGANWLLWIEVDDSKIVGLRVRVQDDIYKRPSGAPPDRVLSTNRSNFPPYWLK